MINAESVKARLKNFAIETGHTFQEALTYYGLERTIYRISVSKYSEHFVLKGGIFLYAIFDGNYERATTDIDFLARQISNSSEEMKTVFHNILSQKIDDALVFETDSITVEDITEFKKYHGLHISCIFRPVSTTCTVIQSHCNDEKEPPSRKVSQSYTFLL